MDENSECSNVIGVFDDCENALFALDEKRKDIRKNNTYIVRRITKNELYKPNICDTMSWSAEDGYQFYPEITTL